MLANNAYKRSVKSLRSLVSFYGHDEIPESSLLSSLDTSCAKVIHLPPSLDSSDLISPALWSWVQSSDFNSKLSSSLAPDVRVMAYSGQSLTQFPPPHLAAVAATQITSLSGSSDTLGSAATPTSRITKKSPRKSVLGNGTDALSIFQQNPAPKTPRFLLHLCNIRLKSNVSTVYCRIHLGSQRVYTASYTCAKDGGRGVVVDINEAFLFDLPNDREEFTVSVYMYTTAMTTLTSSLIGKQNNGGDTLLGQVSFSLPVTKEFPKVSGRYAFTNSARKEIGKCGVKIGLFLDESGFSATKKETKPFGGYLNFFLRSNRSFGVWRKYWAVLGRNVLAVYDFEHKTDIPAIGYIPVEYIKEVKDADKHIVGTDKALEISVSSKFLPRNGASVETFNSSFDANDDEWERVWRQSIVDAGVGSAFGSSVIYALAETLADLNQWKEEFTKIYFSDLQ